jgi:ATP-binding cassette subfamily C protein LapB
MPFLKRRASARPAASPQDGPTATSPAAKAPPPVQNAGADAPAPKADTPAAKPTTTPPHTSVSSDDPMLTCLAMLAQLLDRPTSIAVLSAGLPLPKEGPTPAPLILRAAERAGLKAGLVRKPHLQSINALTLPCILILQDGGACVLTEVQKKSGWRGKPDCTVLLPETGGAQTMPLSDLQEQYSGYAIFAKPEARFDRRTTDLKLADVKRWFWGTLLKFTPIYTHVLLASIVVNMFGIASPLFIMNVYDRVVPNNATETLTVLAIGVVIVFMFDFLLRNLRSYFVDVAGKNADVIIASKLFQQVMNLRMDKRPQSTGTLANNLREFESLREFFSSSTIVALVDLPFVFIFIWVISLIGGPLAIVPLVAVPLVFLVGAVLQIPLRHTVEKSYRETAQRHALLVESIGGLEAIKAAGAEGQMQSTWERLVGLSAESTRNGRIFATLSTTIASLSTQLVTVAIVVFGVYLISERELTVGALVACTILTGRALAPLTSIAGMLTRLQQSRIALKGLDSIMKVETERSADKNFVHRDRIEPSIEFRQISFSYPEAQTKVLNDVSFRIEPGEKVGIVGRIGSGKSTIGRLVLGLYQPQDGAVQIGGSDIRQIDPADLRRNLGYVSQDTHLFFGSVKENIAFGVRNVDDAMILRAAQLAGVSDFIERTPQGYDLQVGERGTALSGGQRQAVAIARALLLDPPLLVLDEPTSSMDNATEAAFRNRLGEIVADKTLLLITHRGSLLQMVDRIIIVDNGRIVADGPREAVLDALKRGHIRGASD